MGKAFQEFYDEYKKRPEAAEWEAKRRAKQLELLERDNPKTCPTCKQDLLQPHPNYADFFEDRYQCLGCGEGYTPREPVDERGNDQTMWETDCHRCDNARQLTAEKAGVPMSEWIGSRMILCPDCGNKRCPKATWHENACTGSNEPGQDGSSYR